MYSWNGFVRFVYLSYPTGLDGLQLIGHGPLVWTISLIDGLLLYVNLGVDFPFLLFFTTVLHDDTIHRLCLGFSIRGCILYRNHD
jgi:hypothetical protein